MIDIILIIVALIIANKLSKPFESKPDPFRDYSKD